MAYVLVGIICAIAGAAIGRFVLASPLQRKIDAVERSKTRLEKVNEETESENRQLKAQNQQLQQSSQSRSYEDEATYEARLQELEQSYQAQIRALQEQLDSASASAGTNDDIVSLQQTHQASIQEIRANHQDQLDGIERSYQRQIQELQSAHQSTLDDLQQTHQSQIQELQAAHQAEIRQLESTYQTQMLEIQQAQDGEGEPREARDRSSGLSGLVTGAIGAAAGVAAGFGAAELFSRDREEEIAEPVAEETAAEETAAEEVVAEEAPPESWAEEYAGSLDTPEGEDSFDLFSDSVGVEPTEGDLASDETETEDSFGLFSEGAAIEELTSESAIAEPEAARFSADETLVEQPFYSADETLVEQPFYSADETLVEQPFYSPFAETETEESLNPFAEEVAESAVAGEAFDESLHPFAEDLSAEDSFGSFSEGVVVEESFEPFSEELALGGLAVEPTDSDLSLTDAEGEDAFGSLTEALAVEESVSESWAEELPEADLSAVSPEIADSDLRDLEAYLDLETPESESALPAESAIDATNLEALLDTPQETSELLDLGDGPSQSELEFLEMLQEDSDQELSGLADEMLQEDSEVELPDIGDEELAASLGGLEDLEPFGNSLSDRVSEDEDPFASLFDTDEGSSKLEFLEMLQTEDDIATEASMSDSFANLFESDSAPDLEFMSMLPTDEEVELPSLDEPDSDRASGFDSLFDDLSFGDEAKQAEKSD